MINTNNGQFRQELTAMIKTVGMLPERVAAHVFKRSLDKFGRMYVRKVQESLRGKSSDRDTLHRRTGALSRAFNHTTTKTTSGQSLLIWVDNTVKNYWRTHEEGKTITAKPGKSLAIPVGPALTPAGVSRFNSPRDVQGLFMVKSHSKNRPGVVTASLGKIERGKVVVYFVLKKSVKIPPRLGLSDKWRKELLNIIPILKDETNVALSNISKHK